MMSEGTSNVTNHITQAAAQLCAELSNAEAGGECYNPENFADKPRRGAYSAFRRRIETEDALKREVLVLLEPFEASGPKAKAAMDEAKALLRATLLPDPKPTLLEEFIQYSTDWIVLDDDYKAGVIKAFDWIAKRGLEVKP